MKSSSTAFVMVVGALFFVVLIAGTCLKSPQPSPTAVTRYSLHTCHVGIKRAEAVSGKPIEAQVRQYTNDSLALNREICSLLLRVPDVAASVLISTDTPPALIDGWGTPLNCELRPRFGTNVFPQDFKILMWSSGPNRSNEFRGGDDVSADE